MSLEDYLNKQRKFHEPANIYVEPKQPIQSNFINNQFETAKLISKEPIFSAADIIIADRKKQPKKFDIAEYGDNKIDIIENIIRLKPSHSDCRKVMKHYIKILMDEDIFDN